MKSTRLQIGKILISAAALLACGVTIWFAVGKPYLSAPSLKAPFGGKIEKATSEEVVISDAKVTEFYSLTALPSELRPLFRVPELRISGELQYPGMKALPFQFISTPTGKNGIRRMEFSADDGKRRFKFDGEYQFSAQKVTGTISGTLGQTDFRAMRLDTPDFAGTVEFEGKTTIAGPPENILPELTLTGRFSPGSWIGFGQIRIPSPGRFHARKQSDGAWSLRLPDAVLPLGPMELAAPELRRAANNPSIQFGARLQVLPPARLSTVIPVSGTINPTAKHWQFTASLHERFLFSDDRLTADFDRLVLRGEGGATNGTIRYELSGSSAALRPGSDATMLCSGIGVHCVGEEVFRFVTSGKLVQDSGRWQIDFKNFDFALSGRRFHAKSPRFSVERPPKRPGSIWRVSAAELTASAPDGEQLTLMNPAFSGEPTAGNDRIVAVDDLQGTAEQFSYRFGDVRLAGRSLKLNGNFDRIQGNGKLATVISAESGTVQTGICTADARHLRWKLNAEFARGSDLPLSWDHRIESGAGNLACAKLSTTFPGGEIKLGFTGSPAILRSAGFSLLEPKWQYKPEKAERWQGLFSQLEFSCQREADGWQGALRAGGTFSIPERHIQGEQLDFQLTFVPPSAPEPGKGKLTIGKISGPSGLIESLAADFTARGNEIKWKGNTHSGLFSGGGFFFAGTFQSDRFRETWRLDTEYDLPPTTAQRPLKPELLLPVQPGWSYTGKLGMAGRLAIGSHVWTNEFTCRLAGDAVRGDSALTGLTGTLGSSGESKLNFVELLWGGWRIPGGNLTLRHLGNKKWEMVDGAFSLAGGSARLLADGTDGYKIELHAISPGKLLPILAGLDGKFDGTVKIALANGVPEPVELELVSGAAALHLENLEPYRFAAQPEADPMPAKFATAALRDFKATRSSIRLRRSAAGDFRMRIIAEGRPAKELPYFYENGRFRPLRQGEYGFSNFVTITSDYRKEPKIEP